MKSNDLNDVFIMNIIQETVLEILTKHEVFYLRDPGLRNFVCMINMGQMFFEIYESDTHTYLTYKDDRPHIRMSNPEEIYEIAEMIGFLIGRKHANPYYAV